MNKKIWALILTSALFTSCAACGNTIIPQEDTTAVETTTQISTAADVSTENHMFTSRDLDASYSDYISIKLADGASTSSESDAVKISGDIVTISKEGTYMLSGTLTNGQLIVDVSDTQKVQLVLNSAHINCNGSAAVYIKQADKVFITVDKSTENALSSTGEFAQTDDNNVDAAIFSKADLTMNGSGSVLINCEKGHGIVSKDDLKVTQGTYSITAASKGLSGKDSVRIANGVFSVNSGSDAINSTNSEDTSRGYVYIENGTFTLTAGTDAIDASGTLTVSGGTFNISTGNTGTTSDGSYKGLKSSADMNISGGSFTIACADDAVHSNGSLNISGGTFDISSGDDGIHADSELNISAGTVNISKSYEGLEGACITISGGVISVVASDDGLNAAGGNDSSSTDGRPGQNPFDVDMSASITISGGNLTINANGDGIDSNGTLTVSGGTTYVNGPTNSGNGALDFGSSGIVTGGIVIAVGAIGMDQNFGTDSTQGTILTRLSSTQQGGTTVSLKDSNSNILAQFKPEKEYQSIIISAPGIESGSTYTLSAGNTTETIEMTSIVYGSSSQMDGGFSGGKGGGMRKGIVNR